MGISFAKKLPAGFASQTDNPARPPIRPEGSTFLMKGAAAKAAVQTEETQSRSPTRRRQPVAAVFAQVQQGRSDHVPGRDAGQRRDARHSPLLSAYIQIGSGWESFVCTAEIDTSQPCPLCETGDKPGLVGVMTVIDHSTSVVEKGPNAGKVYKNQRRLFVAKEITLKTLNKLAAKPERNGLALCTFDVSRGPENSHSPRVGDTFDFAPSTSRSPPIAEKYEIKPEDCVPATYDGDEGEIVYRTPAQLIELGLGKPHTGVGYERASRRPKTICDRRLQLTAQGRALARPDTPRRAYWPFCPS